MSSPSLSRVLPMSCPCPVRVLCILHEPYLTLHFRPLLQPQKGTSQRRCQAGHRSGRWKPCRAQALSANDVAASRPTPVGQLCRACESSWWRRCARSPGHREKHVETVACVFVAGGATGCSNLEFKRLLHENRRAWDDGCGTGPPQGSCVTVWRVAMCVRRRVRCRVRRLTSD